MKVVTWALGSLLILSVVTGITVVLDPYFSGGYRYSIEGLWLIVLLLTVMVPVGIYSYRADSQPFAVHKLRQRKGLKGNKGKKKVRKASERRSKAGAGPRRGTMVAVKGDIRVKAYRGRKMLF